jgi:hypothetical protein
MTSLEGTRLAHLFGFGAILLSFGFQKLAECRLVQTVVPLLDQIPIG